MRPLMNICRRAIARNQGLCQNGFGNLSDDEGRSVTVTSLYLLGHVPFLCATVCTSRFRPSRLQD